MNQKNCIKTAEITQWNHFSPSERKSYICTLIWFWIVTGFKTGPLWLNQNNIEIIWVFIHSQKSHNKSLIHYIQTIDRATIALTIHLISLKYLLIAVDKREVSLIDYYFIWVKMYVNINLNWSDYQIGRNPTKFYEPNIYHS